MPTASTDHANPGDVSALDRDSEDRFFAGAAEATRFFMGQADVQRALEKLVARLEADAIPYAVLDAMALNAYGCRRATLDVDVLLTPEGLAAFKARHLGRGYLERVPGGSGLRATEHGVDINVMLAGQYAGNGRPNPVSYPDPEVAAARGARGALLPLPRLLELELASGMTAPHRLRDLADVLEVIRFQKLGQEFAEQLHQFVRGNYRELWHAAQTAGEDGGRQGP